MRWARHAENKGEIRQAYTILDGLSEGRRPLRRRMLG
jgi:hypothetical protein